MSNFYLSSSLFLSYSLQNSLGSIGTSNPLVLPPTLLKSLLHCLPNLDPRSIILITPWIHPHLAGFLHTYLTKLKTAKIWTSLVAQWLRLCTSTAGGTGSIPGQGSSTRHVVWQKKKKKNLLKPNSIPTAHLQLSSWMWLEKNTELCWLVFQIWPQISKILPSNLLHSWLSQSTNISFHISLLSPDFHTSSILTLSWNSCLLFSQ